jgi:hypothetical protein
MGPNGFIFKKKIYIKERKKSWGPFRICLVNSTANPANLHLDFFDYIGRNTQDNFFVVQPTLFDRFWNITKNFKHFNSVWARRAALPNGQEKLLWQ